MPPRGTTALAFAQRTSTQTLALTLPHPKKVLEDNQLHDLCKSVMQLHSDLLMIGNSICNNLHHINIKEDKAVAMY